MEPDPATEYGNQGYPGCGNRPDAAWIRHAESSGLPSALPILRNSAPSEARIRSDYRVRPSATAAWLRGWMCDRALPFWAGEGRDVPGLGFHETLRLDGLPSLGGER